MPPPRLAERGRIVDGRLNFQDFEEATGVNMPSRQSDTVAGFVVQRLGRLAAVGDIVEVDDATLKVTAMDRRRIAEILVTKRPAGDAALEDGAPG